MLIIISIIWQITIFPRKHTALLTNYSRQTATAHYRHSVRQEHFVAIIAHHMAEKNIPLVKLFAALLHTFCHSSPSLVQHIPTKKKNIESGTSLPCILICKTQKHQKCHITILKPKATHC